MDYNYRIQSQIKFKTSLSFFVIFDKIGIFNKSIPCFANGWIEWGFSQAILIEYQKVYQQADRNPYLLYSVTISHPYLNPYALATRRKACWFHSQRQQLNLKFGIMADWVVLWPSPGFRLLVMSFSSAAQASCWYFTVRELAKPGFRSSAADFDSSRYFFGLLNS